MRLNPGGRVTNVCVCVCGGGSGGGGRNMSDRERERERERERTDKEKGDKTDYFIVLKKSSVLFFYLLFVSVSLMQYKSYSNSSPC